jgi:hypothetical protein
MVFHAKQGTIIDADPEISLTLKGDYHYQLINLKTNLPIMPSLVPPELGEESGSYVIDDITLNGVYKIVDAYADIYSNEYKILYYRNDPITKGLSTLGVSLLLFGFGTLIFKYLQLSLKKDGII